MGCVFAFLILKYVCCCSGGKDSVCSVILCKEFGLQLDYVIYSEIMYDKKRGISLENEQHIRFVKEILKPQIEAWGYKFLILHSDMDYLDCFNRKIENPRKHMEHKGLRFGFPVQGFCGVKRDCKIRPIKEFYRNLNKPYVEIVGIAADEPKRLAAMKKSPNKVSVLEKYGYTEEMARKKCEEYGLLSPAYEFSNRGGCILCPYARLEEHLYLKKNNPELWTEFVSLEDANDIAFNRWNVHRETLKERDKILAEMMDD